MLKITPWAPSTVVSSNARPIAFCRHRPPMLAGSFANPHHRRPRVGHNRLDVAKSRLMRPGCVMRSLIPAIP